MSTKKDSLFFKTVLFCYKNSNYVCAMEDIENLIYVEALAKLQAITLELYECILEEPIDKSVMSDLIAQINELSLHLRTFID